jgi:hypothetical protein
MDEYIRIAKLRNEVEAGLLESVLNEAGIPHAIVSFHDAAFDGIFQMDYGWGAVDGLNSNRDKILDTLTRLREATILPEDAAPSAAPDGDESESSL